MGEMSPFLTLSVKPCCCAVWGPRFLHLVGVIRQRPVNEESLSVVPICAIILVSPSS